MLEFDATLDAECRFLEHLHSVREVKGPHDCSKTLKMGIKNFKTSYHTVS